jgi:hypothetical protein
MVWCWAGHNSDIREVLQEVFGKALDSSNRRRLYNSHSIDRTDRSNPAGR